MSRIYNILNTLINKVQFKVMSQTIGGENTVEGCLNTLNGKTPTIHVFRHTGTSTNGYILIPYPTGYDVNSHYVVTAQYEPSVVVIAFSTQRSANNLVVYTRKITDGSVYNGEITCEVLCLK